MNGRTRLALVTGASSGIGLACAQRLGASGWQVLAGARSQDGLSRLSRVHGCIPLELDVSSSRARMYAVDEIVRASAAGLDLLVNNAGVAAVGPLEAMESAAIEECIATNLTAVLDLTRLCTPELRKAADAGRRPRIINMGSLQSFHAMPGFSVYSATKFAIRGLSDALRVELAPLGIGVVCIEPGSVATPIWAKGHDALRRLSESASPRLRDDYCLEPFAAVIARVEGLGIGPERVARIVTHAATARRPRSRYSVGADARVFKLVAHLLPSRWSDALTRRMVGLRRPRVRGGLHAASPRSRR